MGNIQNGELSDAVGIFQRHPPRHGRPPVVADQQNLFPSIGVDESNDVLGQLINIIGRNACRLVAYIIAALIGRNHQIAPVCKIPDLFAPGIPEFREAMEKKNHRAVGRPGFHNVQFYSVGFNVSLTQIHFGLLLLRG